MAERHTIETYGRAPHNRNIWPHNSRAAPSRLADSFVLQVSVYPLLTLLFIVLARCRKTATAIETRRSPGAVGPLHKVGLRGLGLCC